MTDNESYRAAVEAGYASLPEYVSNMGRLPREMVTYIDPPSGWRYGFPKVFPKEAHDRTLEWLVEEGYPQWEIDKMKKHFYCRYWQEPAEPVENVGEFR